jgi:hypothetical protein
MSIHSLLIHDFSDSEYRSRDTHVTLMARYLLLTQLPSVTQLLCCT